MKVVDLRNVFTSCNDELIEITDSLIYYAEEKVEEGHPSLFLLEYNRVMKRERVIANYLLPGPACVQHFFSFPNDIVVVSESGGSEAWVIRVDKRTGEEHDLANLHFIGDFQQCLALDEFHILFFTVSNKQHEHLFRKYEKLTGFSRVVFLYDLKDGKYYYARDPRVCGNLSGFLPFSRCGVPWLLILSPHGSESEKEKCYHNMRWLGDNINDSVWECPLHDFIVSVKNGEERAPLDLLLSAGTAGLVRYAGQDDNYLYFRARYFPTGDQRICACSKRTGRKTVAAKLTLGPDEKPAQFSIDPLGGRAYRITDEEDAYHVTGVLNSSVDADLPKELGRFVTCVDDRFLIAQYILTDGNDSFEFHSILDTETGTQKSYECRCTVCGDTVVLH
ncbi:MAG: 6-phosphogluconolactonase [Thermocaproicibacter melissae]|uniref:hypothetical protein n=1 Tax=Thermocaproicibacter melissae TaxID=2966552 RepID=UPI003A103542